MFPELALKLIPILSSYSIFEELRELAGLFDVHLTALDDYDPEWLSVTRELMEHLEHGNTRRPVDSVLDLAEARNDGGVAHERLACLRQLLRHR
jgi:hypothetical protein